MVTVLPDTEHAPTAVMMALAVEFVVAETVKLVPFAALGGAPVNVTLGGALAITKMPLALPW
jgi:hypothetical protein